MLSKLVASRHRSSSPGFDQYLHDAMARERVRKRLALLGENKDERLIWALPRPSDGQEHDDQPLSRRHRAARLLPHLPQAVAVPRLWEDADVSGGGDSLVTHSISVMDLSVRSRSSVTPLPPIIFVPRLNLEDGQDEVSGNTNNSQDCGSPATSDLSNSSLTHVSTLHDADPSPENNQSRLTRITSSGASETTIPGSQLLSSTSPHSNTQGEACSDSHPGDVLGPSIPTEVPSSVASTASVSIPDIATTGEAYSDFFGDELQSSVASVVPSSSAACHSTPDIAIVDGVMSDDCNINSSEFSDKAVGSRDSQAHTMPRVSNLSTKSNKHSSGSFIASVATSIWSAAELVPQSPEPCSSRLPAISSPDQHISHKVADWLNSCQDHLVEPADDPTESPRPIQTAVPCDASKSASSSTLTTKYSYSTTVSAFSDHKTETNHKEDHLVQPTDDPKESPQTIQTVVHQIPFDVSKSVSSSSLTTRYSYSTSVSAFSDHQTKTNHKEDHLGQPADDPAESSHTVAHPVLLETSESTSTLITRGSHSASGLALSHEQIIKSNKKTGGFAHRFRNSLANVRRIQKLWRPKPDIPCNPLAAHQKLY